MAHPRRRGGGLLAALGLAALLAVLPPLTRVPPPEDPAPAAADLRDSCGHGPADAAATAEAVVRRRVAGEIGFRDEAVSRTGDTWTVTGAVDTRDGAGGLLRRDFTVIFTCTGGGRYRVDLCRVG